MSYPLIAELPLGSLERITLLQKFTTDHAASQSFVGVLSSADKKTIIKRLLTDISSSDVAVAADELTEILKMLRILAREFSGSEAIFEPAAVQRFMEIGGIAAESDTSLDLTEMTAMQLAPRIEAQKTLVNITLRSASYLTEFGQRSGHLQLVKMLRSLYNNAKEKLEWVGSDNHENIAFPALRLLFAAIRPLDFGTNNLVDEVLAKGGVTIIGDWLELVLSETTPCGKAFPAVIPNSWSDLVRMLIALTIDMGPLGKMDKTLLQKHVPNFDTLMASMMKIIHVSAEVNEDAANDIIPNHPLHTLAMTVSSALCNIPVDFIGVIAGGDLYGCVKSLCLVLRAQFSNTEEDDKALVPHLMVMGTLAKGVPASRRHFLKVLFPNRDLDAEDNHTGVGAFGADVDTIGNRIMKHMTAIDMALKYWANEMLFQLCDEDAERFVKLTGFGNASGLLVMRNLFGMGQYLTTDSATEIRAARKAAAEEEPAEEEAAEAAVAEKEEATQSAAPAPAVTTASVNKPGLTTFSKVRVEDLEDSDDEETEEDEQERKQAEWAKKLLEMEKKGLVKLVRKGDKEGEEMLLQAQEQQRQMQQNKKASDDDEQLRDVKPSER